jgi:hypothetical protein
MEEGEGRRAHPRHPVTGHSAQLSRLRAKPAAYCPAALTGHVGLPKTAFPIIRIHPTSHVTVGIKESSLAGIRDEVENRGRYG